VNFSAENAIWDVTISQVELAGHAQFWEYF
jgi:hypothetical protein